MLVGVHGAMKLVDAHALVVAMRDVDRAGAE
jgi:hypothetical protein